MGFPSRDGAPSPPPLSPFSSFIFFPTCFWRQWSAFLVAWCPLPAFRSCFVEFARRWNVLLRNLWGRKWSSHPIPPPSFPLSQIICFNILWINLIFQISFKIKQIENLETKSLKNDCNVDENFSEYWKDGQFKDNIYLAIFIFKD